ncbi:hypothetical protein [Bartonella sp. A05]|uniref:hypothetical protein n=1 Tax=Bartonella sp. A05 TaxID=2967261 RepID=UPI003FA430AC
MPIWRDKYLGVEGFKGAVQGGIIDGAGEQNMSKLRFALVCSDRRIDRGTEGNNDFNFCA